MKRKVCLGIGLNTMATGLAMGFDSNQLKRNIQTKKPRVKRVISLFMSGGPSHLDLFDPKPMLHKQEGKPLPESISKGVKFAMIPDNKVPLIKPALVKFRKAGQSGLDISDHLPNVAQIADELCVIRSLHSESFNHDPAVFFMTTGSVLPGRPTLGAWLSYGLGSENGQLPNYVVLKSGFHHQPLINSYWSNGFLPSKHQGVGLRAGSEPILFLNNPRGINQDIRLRQLKMIRWANEKHYLKKNDLETLVRSDNYDMTYHMQQSVPEAMDISQEPNHIHALYGSTPNGEGFSNNCLLARRLAERGVRYIQLFDTGWDQHYNIEKDIVRQTKGVDRGIFGLITDLKQRGLLDDTLVIWGGEFGRTPVSQGSGRDHHPQGFTMWLAGGGFKKGFTYGKTDEFGFHVVENRVNLYDLNATILHSLGIDHKLLTYRHQGLDFRLTNVHGHVIRDLFA